MYVASVNYVLSGYLFPIWVLTVPVSFLLCLSVPDVMPINIIIIIISDFSDFGDFGDFLLILVILVI